MSHACKQCGSCCRVAWMVPKLLLGIEESIAKEYRDFQYRLNENGACEKLCGNDCSVYQTRPTCCNYDAMYEKYFSAKMTKQEFAGMQNAACEIVRSIDREGLYEADEKISSNN